MRFVTLFICNISFRLHSQRSRGTMYPCLRAFFIILSPYITIIINIRIILFLLSLDALLLCLRSRVVLAFVLMCVIIYNILLPPVWLAFFIGITIIIAAICIYIIASLRTHRCTHLLIMLLSEWDVGKTNQVLERILGRSYFELWAANQKSVTSDPYRTWGRGTYFALFSRPQSYLTFSSH